MGGFPGRPSRDEFGPTYEDEFPVENPKRELGQAVINLNMWQLAGAGLVSPKVVITATVSGSAVTVTNQLLAWDPNQTGAAIPIAYNSTGNYTPTFASTYPDEKGNSVATALIGGTALPNNTANINGVVNLTSGFEGVIYLFDADTGVPVNADFTLVIW
jgi:hypothetical protein